MIKFKCLPILAALLLGCMLNAEHARAWQMGKVVDSDSQRVATGSGGSITPSRYNNGADVSTSTVYDTEQFYTIQGRDFILVGRELPMRQIIPRPVQPLTVNLEVRFADEGKMFYVIDENGKERRMVVTKRVKR